MFDARLSGVTRAGLFVRLSESGADGFVPASHLGDEFFSFDEAALAMVGTRTGTTYRLGDTVEVRLMEAAPVAGALRFEVVGGPARHGRSSGSRRAAVSRESVVRSSGDPRPWKRRTRG